METTIYSTPQWVKDLCTIVSEHTGYTIRWENVHSDECGWKAYIPSSSLFTELPLVLCDEVGELHIVLAARSYRSLQREIYSAKMLFENSFWHYGYYRGGCDMLRAIFWQPLEGDDAIGMNDTQKIQSFFNVVTKSDQTDETLSKVCPIDDRKVLVELVRARVYSEFGYAVSEFLMYESDEFSNKVIMKPAAMKNTVDVYLPSDILIRLMYYPGVIDCQHFTDHVEFWLGRKFSHEEIQVPKQCTNLDEFCRNFWRDLRWYNSK